MSAGPTFFGDVLADRVQQRGTCAMVGLDPQPELLPEGLARAHGVDPERPYQEPQKLVAAYRAFLLGVIEVVHELVPAVKVQSAFFEELGPEGMALQGEVIEAASQAGLLVVLDAKRGDIGSTARAYARAALDPHGPWRADAVTVSAYLGPDTLEPYLPYVRRHGRGVFVLVRTSNRRAELLQEAPLAAGGCVAELVAGWVEELAVGTVGDCELGGVGAVVAATAPVMLRRMRELMPHAWFLVPGYGAQGGTAQDVAAAWRPDGLGALVNSSRGILRGARVAEAQGKAWQQGVRDATVAMTEALSEAWRRS